MQIRSDIVRSNSQTRFWGPPCMSWLCWLYYQNRK